MTDTRVSPDAIIAEHTRPEGAPDPDDLIHEIDGVFHLPEDVPWQIDGRREAEYALAKIRAAHETYADATAPAREAIGILQARINELHEFIAREGQYRDHTVDFFTEHLKAYLRRTRAGEIKAGKDPNKATKSIRLAGGVVWSRAGQDHVDAVEVGELADWATAGGHTGVAWWEPQISIRALKAHIKTTGEVPPGVTYTKATEDDRSAGVDIK